MGFQILNKKFSGLSKNILLLVITLLVVVIGAEIILRTMGYKPYKLKYIKTTAEPGGRLFQPDGELGYSHLPGKFIVTIEDELKFTATHLENSRLRITRPIEQYSSDLQKDEIWIFGGSVSYGWGVNDNECYPYLLQEKFSEYEIVNFCVSGFGTLQSLIQFKNELKNGRKPKYVVLAYASFHDRRNTLVREHRKFLIGPWNTFGVFKWPNGRLDENGKLKYSMDEVTYTELPLMSSLALVHTFERALIRIENSWKDIHVLTKEIVNNFYDLCEKNDIKFIVAGIWDDELTMDMLEYCRNKGIPAVDINVDLTIKGNSNRPYDEHPSPFAHRQYAEALEKFLKDSILVSN